MKKRWQSPKNRVFEERQAKIVMLEKEMQINPKASLESHIEILRLEGLIMDRANYS